MRHNFWLTADVPTPLLHDKSAIGRFVVTATSAGENGSKLFTMTSDWRAKTAGCVQSTCLLCIVTSHLVIYLGSSQLQNSCSAVHSLRLRANVPLRLFLGDKPCRAVKYTFLALQAELTWRASLCESRLRQPHIQWFKPQN